ncbi:MAG TPA: hypothetical protein VLM79_15450, partial [Kofleriaceae bacterium]|nr:hypothetical protein [Kofleriaceae bacterium]
MTAPPPPATAVRPASPTPASAIAAAAIATVARAASVFAACAIAACTAPGCSQPPAVERIEIDDPVAHWIDGGFAEMVPAIRLPTTPSGNDRITNWLRIPDGERIGVRGLKDGRIVPTYPGGTIADRIELREPVTGPEGIHAWNVIDVRGDPDAQYAPVSWREKSWPRFTQSIIKELDTDPLPVRERFVAH